MKKFLISSCVLTFLMVPLSAVPAENNVTRGTLSVSYSAEKEVAPDTVEVSIAIKTTDKKSMQVAVSNNKEISSKVYNYLKTGINPSQGDYIKTSNYSASPVYKYVDNKRNFDKYEVSNSIIVHTKSIDKIGTLIDKSLEFGATNVNSLNFILSEKDSQCEELLKTASQNVRKRADIIANASGTVISGIKDISTSCSLNSVRPVAYSRNMLMAKAVGSSDSAYEESSTNIESGNIKVYANVNAIFFVK